jgi:STE24 endopeptidase
VLWATGAAQRVVDALGLGVADALISASGPAAWLALAAGVVLLILAFRLVLLPVGYCVGYRVSRRYGLTTQSTPAWLVDWVKTTAVAVVLGTLVALAFYACVVTQGAGWWWAYGALMSASVVLLTYVAPYVLLPLFFRLRPLEPGPLTERIEALFARAGAARPRVAAIDLSTRTTAANAAVIGLGTSRRVVLGDTLLESFTPEEIETVVAHELGHHLHADIWRGIALEIAVLWAGLALAASALEPVFALMGWGDWRAPAALPLLVLLAELGGLVILPVTNAFSRRLERAADRFALSLTDQPAAFAGAMRKLANQNLIELEPPRWAEILLATHPAVARRIRMAEAHTHA